MYERLIHVSVVILLIGLTGCRKEKSERTEVHPDSTQSGLAAGDSDYEALFDSISTALGLLKTEESDTGKDHAVQVAWDSVSGGFFCPGKAAADPRLPEAARYAAMQRAAQLTARKQAMFFREWKLRKYRKMTAPLQGQITYSDVVFEKIDGDTLKTLMLVPFGSIVVE